MNDSKSLLFSIIFIIALIVAGVLLLSKQNELPSKKTINSSKDLDTQDTTGSLATSESDVLGIQKSSHTAQEKIASPIYSEYTTQNALKRLALTKENIIWQTNLERSKRGLTLLRVDESLNNSAQRKNNDMFDYQYFGHTRENEPSRTGFDTFIDAENYQFIKIGENLARGDFSTSAEVVAAWMNSTSHRKNILDTQYKDIGVAINSGEINGRIVILITQHFGSSRDSCPSVNDSTKRAIENLRNIIADLQVEINVEQKNISQTSALIDPRFDALIHDYNKIVATYNTSIKTLGELINDYNTQIKNYDRCISGGY